MLRAGLLICPTEAGHKCDTGGYQHKWGRFMGGFRIPGGRILMWGWDQDEVQEIELPGD